MVTEKRAYQRHTISWDAEVGGIGFGPLAFVITNFCEGGLFLEPATQAGDAELRRHLQRSDWVDVGLTDPVSGSRRNVHSRIARVSDHGFGLAFDAPQPGIVSALMTVVAGTRSATNSDLYGEKKPHLASGGSSRSHHSHLSNCRDTIAAFLTARLETFLTQTDALLLRSAESARTEAEQGALLSALNAINSHRRQLSNNLCEEVLGYWGQLGRFSINADTAVASTPDQLSLVDNNEFEDWLARSDLITRAESYSLQRLRRLHQRLSLIAESAIDEYRNPVSPAVLCHVLSQQLLRMDIAHHIRLLIYPTYGRTVLGQVGELYDTLNKHLGDAGILPDLETSERLQIIRHPSAEPVRNTTSSKPDSSKPTTSAPRSGSSAQVGSISGPGGSGDTRGSSQIASSMRELFRAHCRQVSAEHADNDPRPPAPLEALLKASDTLRQTKDNPDGPLSERLRAALSRNYPDNPPRLNGRQTESVDLLDEWFNGLRPDADEQPFFKYWSERLKPFALQEELRSGAILDGRDHAVHRLINALDLATEIMAVSTVDERKKLQDQLAPTLEQAVEDSDARPESLADAAEQVESLLQRSQRALEAGMERVRQSCEGAQRLELARQTVELALARQFGGKAVPQPVMRLLEQGWRNHLVLLELRQGTDSVDWTRSLRAVELLATGIGSPDIPRRKIKEPGKVLQYVKRLLLASNRPQTEVGTLMTEIEEWLQRPNDSRDMPPTQVFQWPEERPGTPDLPQEWLGQAKLLRIGDWIQLRNETGHRRQLRLAWISKDQSRFVFVRRNGQKAAELTLQELARQLGNQQADTDTDFNAPITERRWQEMLVRINRQLVHSATHDPLTGLLNRSAFQRRIRALLERSPGGQQHTLMHIALDDFKVVNNSLGHAGGDQALRLVGQLLLDQSGSRAIVGRIGGDEFGVLMVRCGAEEGKALAEKYLLAIRQHRFTIGDSTVRIAASIGLVPFSRESHGMEDLLKDSDGTNVTAKKNGGNRIHVYTPGDAELQKLRESMNQATRVDHALEAGLLTLRCQRIEPLQGTGNSRPHYEVLISMKSDSEDSIRPDQFIPAAERFGRMPALDRWVIREVLRWAARNPGRLEEIEGLSINLSGQSLNDPEFLAYLKEQFRESGVPPRKICLEVTETAAVANLALVVDLIRELKKMGCRVALDDFGSGLASYSYLKNLPADYLKLDGEFIRDLNREDADDTMVKSIHELSHHLGKMTVAEYVETESVRRRLTVLGLDYGQGYAIERPRPLDELALKPHSTTT